MFGVSGEVALHWAAFEQITREPIEKTINKVQNLSKLPLFFPLFEKAPFQET